MLGKLLWHELLRSLIVERKIWNSVLWPAAKFDQVQSALLTPKLKLLAKKRNGTAATSSSRLPTILALTISDCVGNVLARRQFFWRSGLLVTGLTQIFCFASVSKADVAGGRTLLASITQFLVFSSHGGDESKNIGSTRTIANPIRQRIHAPTFLQASPVLSARRSQPRLFSGK